VSPPDRSLTVEATLAVGARSVQSNATQTFFAAGGRTARPVPDGGPLGHLASDTCDFAEDLNRAFGRGQFLEQFPEIL